MKFFAEKIKPWTFIPTIFYEPMQHFGFCGETRHSVGLQFGPFVAGVEWTK